MRSKQTSPDPRAALMLALVALAEEDIRKGRVHTHDEVFAAARKRLAERRGRPGRA